MNRIPKFVGMFVAIALVALLASPVLGVTVVGTVKTVNANQNQFILTDQNGRDWTIQLAQTTQIQAGTNNQARVNDLRPGQVVTVNYELQNNLLVASDIRAAQPATGTQTAQGNQAAGRNEQVQPNQQAQGQTQVGQAGQQGRTGQLHHARGKIENVNAEKNQFTLKEQNGHELTFGLGREGRFQVDGKEAKLNELKQGQEVTVTFHSMLTAIRAGEKNQGTGNQAAEQQGQMIRGQIEQVQAAQQQLRLRDQNGKEHTFQVSQNTQIQVNGRNATLADLQQGQQVTAMRQLVANEIRTGNANPNQTPNRNENR